MKILAMDTSTLVMSVAVMEDNRVLGEVTTNLHKNHSVRLMPTVVGLMEDLDLSVDDLDAVAVAAGPGSYTGVRIGFTTAKTIAWSRKLPLIPVSSLAVLAMSGLRFPGGVVPLFDARRNRVYTGLYRREGERLTAVKRERVMDVNRWLEELDQEGPCLFLGDDVHRFQETIADQLGKAAVFGLPAENTARASYLGQLALDHYRLGETPAADNAAPDYLQLAEAEAKWLRTQGTE
ncbi:tRNA (adenosine(37)-N6)-threonylcarbamoyltransferase complex dimerization subunit type 1 TsaB [Paludifilum halophilum]|uniref:tRNA (Adenosine(37)-N6)-threonylcarbamoyltransferase complex dimerization subunit type 1 TsaB n=1 Tax=Paludifilum halophilum TaxID=1642702 RepID=A0A235B344_9BACL|nr:tRNA (adenosine(37)-N6)-threonylcarbamoyltransferase complex dimerization subunit type 1 TsaB [Paludifilum halophilum]OYD06738.1 tRNA (adenosine(37)-N6)-threonylcarbamoyltransferase complex dimerization subunit type 1 TsaB [Paludifilum halophilum]